jgi:hypothetical protein
MQFMRWQIHKAINTTKGGINSESFRLENTYQNHNGKDDMRWPKLITKTL